MSTDLAFSAVICTLDRGPDVELSIRSLVDQDLPGAAFEILLVDNGSAEANAAVLRRAAEALPERVRYVREERLGESSARNCSLREARGRILAWLDDDAIADPGWLRSLGAAFDADPRLGVAGGPVRLRYLAPRPEWVGPLHETLLSGFDRGTEAGALGHPESPRGANMAFRREVFDDAGPFSELFGRKGDCLLSYSEIEMAYRAAAAGWGVGYVPGAGVDHLVPAGRMTREWFVRRVHWQGRSEALFDRVHHGRLRVLSRVARHVAGFARKRDLRRHRHAGYLAGAWTALRAAVDGVAVSDDPRAGP